MFQRTPEKKLLLSIQTIHVTQVAEARQDMPNTQDDSQQLSYQHSADPPVSVDGGDDYKAHAT